MNTTFKLAALATVLAPSLHAQTSTWNGSGGNANWTTVMVLRRRRQS